MYICVAYFSDVFSFPLSKNTDLVPPTIMFYFLPRVFTYVCFCMCVAAGVSVVCLFPAARPWDESLCVAVGTLPALLINIANPKVHKNVPF